jgi:hypothetical protein
VGLLVGSQIALAKRSTRGERLGVSIVAYQTLERFG